MRAKHAPCSCGCGEMADECMSGRRPLAAFTVREAVGSRTASQIGSSTDAADTTRPYLSDNDQQGGTP